MNIFSVAIMYMVVSCCTFIIQMWKLWSLLYQWPDTRTSGQSHVHRGLIRTSICRVLAAFVYVTVGIYTLRSESIMTEFSLWVFAGVQLIWILNAFADVRLWSFISRKVENTGVVDSETTESSGKSETLGTTKTTVTTESTTTRSGDTRE
jgi:hypothetical protein